MLASIPWPKENKNRKRRRSELPECMRLLQVTKRLYNSKISCKDTTRELNNKWKMSTEQLMEATSEHYSRRQCYDQRATIVPHNFYSCPETWAVNIGSKPETADTWTINSKYTYDASINQNKDPLFEYHAEAIERSEWRRSSYDDRFQIIASRQQMVRKAKRITVRTYCRNMRIGRRNALRRKRHLGMS